MYTKLNILIPFNRLFLVSFLLFPLLLSSCSSEYWDYHNKKANNIIVQSNNAEISRQFNINKIEYRDFQILMTPDKTVIDKIIDKINKAKTRVYIETYILTEKRIIKSVLDAKKRWIDIQVILEKNVYWLWNINKKNYEALNLAWAKAVYANQTNYNFTHAKFFIIDNEYIISTGNVSYSTYTQNREFLAIGNNQEDLKYLETVFQKDFIWEKYSECNSTIISSPNCTRAPLYKIIESAKKSVYIYEQSIDDIEFQDLLINKYKSWVDIKLIIGDINKAKSNKVAFNKFQNIWIKIIAPKKPYVHAKSFLIDNNIFFIWSINLTNNSIENNREIWVIFTNSGKTNRYKTEFERLFTN